MAATVQTQQPNLRDHADFSVEIDDRQPTSGGINAYLKVTGCFLVFFVTLGLISAFGAYQAYYEEILLTAYSSSAISWIGAIQAFLLSFIGTFSGEFYDRGYARVVLISGLGLIVLGLCVLSLAEHFWQILLAQGVSIGVGSGLIYVPAVSIVSHEFTTKRPLALGIAATGSAVGGIVWPIMFRRLLPLVRLAWVNRTFGFLTLLLSVAAYFSLTCKSHYTHHAPRRLQQSDSSRQQCRQTHQQAMSSQIHVSLRSSLASLFRGSSSQAYVFLCIGNFFVFLGYWIPLFYIIPFASLSLGVSSTSASYLLPVLNAGSLFGRVVPAYLGQIIGSATVLLFGASALAVLIFAWLGIENFAGITVWCFLVGFMSGIVVSIPNAVASRLSRQSNRGQRIGIMWTVGAFAELIGSPIAGALVMKSSEGVSYRGGQIFGGATILLGAVLLAVPAWSIFQDDKVREARNA